MLLKNPPMRVVPKNSRIFGHVYLGDNAGCGHYRVIFPSLITNTYRTPNHNIQFFMSYNLQYIMDSGFYKNKLFVVMQRAASENQLVVLKALKTNIKVPVLFEIDDDLFHNDIPE